MSLPKRVRVTGKGDKFETLPSDKNFIAEEKTCKELKAQYVHWGTLRSLFVPALTVSLWMANRSVASADPPPPSVHVDVNQTITNDTTTAAPYGYSLDSDGITFIVADGGTVGRTTSEKSGNTVIVESGGTIIPYDDQPMTAGVSNNVLTFKGTQKKSTSNESYPTLYGGYSTTADEIENNEVTIDGGTVGGAVIGGQISSHDNKSTASVENNTVTVNNSTIGNEFGSSEVYGGISELGVAQNNKVNIMNRSKVGNVYGGRSIGTNHSSGDVLSNLADISDSMVKGSVIGGYAQAAATDGNTVTISRSTVEGDIYGGKSYEGKGNATKNIVTLTDVTVTGTVYGGGFDSDGGKDYVSGNTLNLSGVNSAAGIQNFQSVNITGETWGTPVMTLAGTGADKGILLNCDTTKTKIDASALEFANPETVPNGETMHLIKCTGAAAITADLAATTTAKQEYAVTPVAGMTVNAALQGSLALTDTALTCTAENKATKLTFTGVEWKDSGALLDHAATLSNVSFDGADVDTTNINFTNLQSLEANKKMTLVSSFGGTVGTITGTKYKVGSTLEGTGKASIAGNDLIFTAETGVGNGDDKPALHVQEQTHNTVMGAEVGMAALSAGNDFIGNATEGLSLASNIGADGVSSFAQMGGGSMRQETGSHIDVHTWNAIIALGHQNKKERGTFEYGAFFEYGTGNYSTFNGDERGDGIMHYTGGGLLAKWTATHGMYVEGSLRAGNVHDDARNVLRDFRGMPYSYETSAPYMGFHLGFGKEIEVAGGNVVDVYGKYFFNRRKGVSFDAGGHYDLDTVTSSVLRVGARYVVKRDKWNFYGGVAYEHELDGEAAGKADGVAIRGADVGGGSFRGELGATMTPGDKSPWTLDLNLTGFAGKKRGFTGGVSVAFMF